ncbi:MAG: hypothetical protein VXY77_01885 [Pseudomonadota bacterium]|nr:hypothetical protein [Pseudomonadota bacterium]
MVSYWHCCQVCLTIFRESLVRFRCQECGKALIKGHHCDDCYTIFRPIWRSCYCPFWYQGSLKNHIIQAKSSNRGLCIIRTLCQAYLGYMTHSSQVPLIPHDDVLVVAVPMHWKKVLQRGYNHAAVAAKVFSNNLGVPCALGGLVRTKAGMDQKTLDKHSRSDNVSTVFQAREYYVTSKTIWLVDDVLTTFATVNACTRALLDAGAKEVHVLAFAQTP